MAHLRSLRGWRAACIDTDRDHQGPARDERDAGTSGARSVLCTGRAVLCRARQNLYAAQPRRVIYDQDHVRDASLRPGDENMTHFIFAVICGLIFLALIQADS